MFRFKDKLKKRIPLFLLVIPSSDNTNHILSGYTIKGRETETNEKVIPLEYIPKLIDVIKQELLTKINESWKDLN